MLLGGGAVLIASVAGKNHSWDDIVYDIGFGVLIGTALATFVGHRIREFEQTEERLERERQATIQDLRHRGQRIWEQIGHLSAAIQHTGEERRGTVVEERLRTLDLKVDDLSRAVGLVKDDVQETRRRVDPVFDRRRRIGKAPPNPPAHEEAQSLPDHPNEPEPPHRPVGGTF